MRPVLGTLIAIVNACGERFCEFAQVMFIQVTVLVGLLLALDLFLRRRVSPRFRYGLWLLVLVKLALPPSLALPTGVGYWIRQDAPVVNRARVEAPGRLVRSMRFDGAPAFSQSTGEAEASVPGAPLRNQPRASLERPGMFFLLWLTVIAWFSILLSRRYRGMRRAIRRAQPAPDWLLGELAKCRDLLRTRRPVTVGLSDDVPGPVICGFRHPVLLLPASVPARLSPEERKAVLVHELVHVQRHDTWVHLAQSLLQILYFYHPLVWVANHITARLREQAVDVTVLAALRLKVAQYTRALIHVAEMAYRQPAPSLCFVGLAESRKALTERITQMARYKNPARVRRGWVGLIMIVVVGAVLVPMGQGRPAQPEQANVAMEVPALPEGVAELFELDKDEILERFGRSPNIFYGDQRYTLDELPERYFLAYEDVSFGMDKDAVGGVTLLHPRYVFSNGIRVGATEAEVIAAFGSDHTTREFANKDFLKYGHLGLMFEIYKPERIAREINIGRDYGDPGRLRAHKSLREFTRLSPESMAKLFRLDKDEVLERFGRPSNIFYGDQRYTLDNLPETCFLAYEDVSFCIHEDEVAGVTLLHPRYVFSNGIRVGAKEAEVIAAFGSEYTTREFEIKDFLKYEPLGLMFEIYKPERILREINIERDYTDPDRPRAYKSAAEFARLLPERIAKLRIDKADLAEVKKAFGEPVKYIWGPKTFKADKLPERFIAVYPSGFRVFMSGGRIVELRFERGPANYAFMGLRIGSTLKEALKVLGKPDKVVEGKENAFVDRVLYKDIEGDKGHCYYRRSDHQVRLWFGDYKIIAIYLTRSDYGAGKVSGPFDEAFNAKLAQRIARLDIDKANRQTVETLFGKPRKYVWGQKTFSVDNLPKNYILNYPCDFSVWIKGDKIMEIRHGDGGRYVYAPGVRIGASVEEVLAALGDPVKTVTGQKNTFEDQVLYRDLAGRQGHCYYHRSDKRVRVWFTNNRVISIYMTRSDFPAR